MNHTNPLQRASRGVLMRRMARIALTGALAASATTAVLPARAEPARPRLGACATGELCLWRNSGFTGHREAHELAGTDIESCVPLPPGTRAASLANRTGRPVTTYQSAECAETGEFDTYPSGSWAPESPYLIRAFKIWER